MDNDWDEINELKNYLGLNESDLLTLKLIEKVKELEDRMPRKKVVETTRAQQMLILKHLGIIDIILEPKNEKQQKAKLLSVLLNRSATNIEDDLSYILSNDPNLRSKRDYLFLINVFKDAGLPELEKECQDIFDKIGNLNPKK